MSVLEGNGNSTGWYLDRNGRSLWETADRRTETRRVGMEVAPVGMGVPDSDAIEVKKCCQINGIFIHDFSIAIPWFFFLFVYTLYQIIQSRGQNFNPVIFYKRFPSFI